MPRLEGRIVIARIGGALLIGGLVGSTAVVALTPGSGDVLSGELPIRGGTFTLVPLFLAFAAAGLMSLSLSDVPPFAGRVIAIGLRCLSIGLFALSGVYLISASSGLKGTGIDFLLVPLAGGAFATITGALVTGVALVREPSSARFAGLVLVSGLALVVAGSWARDGNPPEPIAVIVGSIGLIVTGLGGLGLGVLGLVSAEPVAPPRA